MMFVGVMSGTSCDGVDVSLVDVVEDGFTCLATHFQAYPEVLKDRLLDVIAGSALTAREFADLDYFLAEVYAQSVLSLLSQQKISVTKIQCIGLHGQTIDHQPPFNTWQLGSAAHVAAFTGIDVVADFRTLDVALGGEGAPLAPALHQALFYQQAPLAVLNLGGIANMSYLTADGSVGFDTGPANCLMDLWVNQHQQKNHDESGQWAASGTAHIGLLNVMLNEPYFSQLPPKSTGRERFNQTWLEKHLESFSDLVPEDVQATLLQLTVQIIVRDIERYAPNASQLIVCGGGVHNQAMMLSLSNSLSMPVVSSAEKGVDPDHVESILMAWLAAKYPNPINLKAVTGAQSVHVFGVKYRA